MAVASSSTNASKTNVVSSDQKKKMNSNMKELESQKQSENGCHSSAKRTKSPGVRVHHGRVYDSTNGKTCHQCRQKTLDFAAFCKNQKQNNQCTMKFCQKCLLNRYGEKAEEVEALEDWICPKCRGICNCSNCMKKRGHQPTGALAQTAKATGFSSVSELLHVRGPENFVYKKIVKDVGASPQKAAPSGKRAVIASPRKRGKENSFDGKIDINLNPLPLAPNTGEEKPKKMKHEGLKKTPNGNGALSVETSPHPNEKKTKKMKREESKGMHDGDGDDSALLKEASPKKLRISVEIYNKEVKTTGKVDVVLQEENDSETRVSKEVSLQPFRNGDINEDRVNQTEKDVEGLDSMKNWNDGAHYKTIVESLKVNGTALEFLNKALEADPLPQGKELTTVAGADLLPEDVGNALQFLEFCATFGKILNLNKGQPEAVLRELIHGRSGRRGKYSTAVQFHIHLLSFIQEGSGEMSPTSSPASGKTSWLNVLKKCISESQCLMDSLPLDCLDGGYDTLDFSQKLKILNFLCDEILGTVKIRNWIDEQNTRFAEKEKEAREKVLAAKDKEKQMKQKMLDEVAKAVIAKNGAPLSISEHEALVSQIKSEAAQAHAEMLESKGMVPNKKQRSDAIRTDSIFVDDNGCAYWRLKCHFNKTDIICQDIGTGYIVASAEK